MSDAGKTVSAGALKAMLRDGAELALVDVREQGVYAQAHLLFASCIPLSKLELQVADLIPRRGTRIVLGDGGPGDAGLAERAAHRLAEFGYGDVAVLRDGVAGWRAAGFEVFSGVNVPSKAFGEWVEHHYGTPHLSAEELQAKQDAPGKLVILDSRPFAEFQRMSIPGGMDCPGAELAYRVHDLAPDPETLVVVNCAGRTRSIIGAQSLINAGIPNPVKALKNGTMGWKLAGFELAHGESRRAPAPSAQGLAKARIAAGNIAARFGVRTIHRAALAAWRAEAEERTLYLLDVRAPEEFAAGHLADSRSAPGGQLVQATDEYMATRNARVVLVDDDGVRATLTASWLRQMGWQDAYVLADGLAEQPLATGSHQPKILGFRAASTLLPCALKTALDQREAVVIVDLANSLEYRKAHIPGAWWGVRARLSEVLERLPVQRTLVLTAPDDALAHLAAQDAKSLRPGVESRVLAGGTDAWHAASLPLASGDERLACAPDDIWYKPYDQPGSVEQAMRDYLNWEVDLVSQIERDGDARFWKPSA